MPTIRYRPQLPMARPEPVASSPNLRVLSVQKGHPVMAGEPTITIIGNLTDDPELRFTPSGAALTRFRLAATPRYLDRTSGEWRDGEPLFLSCSIWRQIAENTAESLTRGARVIVTGRLRQRSYETRDGDKRTVIELDVEEIGPSLRYATVQIRKLDRTSARNGAGRDTGRDDDPWSGTGSQVPDTSPTDNEAPF
jgi:single-strand DNA-binding protein